MYVWICGRQIYSPSIACSLNRRSYFNFMTNPIRSSLLGLIVGDALGVPVEFKSRLEIAENPVTGMTGYGTYNLPPGTWSDDSSMMLCTAEVLAKGYNLGAIANNFIRWVTETYWTPRGVVFDIGNATRLAISRLQAGEPYESAGGKHENSNGNGSLMRILPLLFLLQDETDMMRRFDVISDVSSLTHGHIRSRLACFYYIEMGRAILAGLKMMAAKQKADAALLNLFDMLEVPNAERAYFARLLFPGFERVARSNIQSSGYVIHTLEAAVWCLLTTQTYEDAVLLAVNLGEDTDTTGAVTGGLAGLYYGANAIPQEWIRGLARLEDIEALIRDWNNRMKTS